LIIETVTFLNDYGCGHEITISLREETVDLDFTYICDDEKTETFYGLPLNAAEARKLAQRLNEAAVELEMKDMKGDIW
jgi:hypothetical protein